MTKEMETSEEISENIEILPEGIGEMPALATSIRILCSLMAPPMEIPPHYTSRTRRPGDCSKTGDVCGCEKRYLLYQLHVSGNSLFLIGCLICKTHILYYTISNRSYFWPPISLFTCQTAAEHIVLALIISGLKEKHHENLQHHA
jgi:hypothetical protein